MAVPLLASLGESRILRWTLGLGAISRRPHRIMIKREHTLSDVSLSRQMRYGVAEANLVQRTSCMLAQEGVAMHAQ
jgi:hypothetical protein